MSVIGRPLLINAFGGTKSGDIVSFGSSLKVGIEPVQDLHGYDSPWPAGGGKNKLPNGTTDATSRTVTFTRNNDGSITINGTATDGAAFFVLVQSGLVLPAGRYYLSGASANATINIRQGSSAGAEIISVSGMNEASFTLSQDTEVGAVVRVGQGITATNEIVYPMLRADGTTSDFAPYSNICPISGWSAVNVWRMGKNLCSMELANIKAINVSGTWSGDAYTHEGVTFTVNTDGGGNVVSISTSGTATNASFIKLNTDLALPEGTYILSGCPVNSVNASIQGLEGAPYDMGSGATFTTINGNGIRIRIPNGENANGLTFYPMIRLSSVSDATYHPYSGDTYEITFPSSAGTVYGGTLTVNGDGSGTLVVDRACRTFSSFISYSATPKLVRVATDAKPVSESVILNGALANYLTATYANNIWAHDVSGFASNPSGYLYAKIAGLDTQQAYTDYLAENPLQIFYPLATPITYTMTPEEVGTILLQVGRNNIWADTGPVTFKFFN